MPWVWQSFYRGPVSPVASDPTLPDPEDLKWTVLVLGLCPLPGGSLPPGVDLRASAASAFCGPPLTLASYPPLVWLQISVPKGGSTRQVQ